MQLADIPRHPLTFGPSPIHPLPRGRFRTNDHHHGLGHQNALLQSRTTAVVKDGVMHVQAGAGIVADSDPAYEAAECRHKAGALIAAAREAVEVAGEPGFGQ